MTGAEVKAQVRETLRQARIFADTVGPGTTPGECNVRIYEADAARRALDGCVVLTKAEAARLCELMRYVPAGFRDEDGIWHDGPLRAEGLALLSPEPKDEP